MNLQRIREYCLSFPDATEQIQWGKDLVFKVGGKMFCVATTEPVRPPKVALSFKCDDETFADLVERDGVIPAPYMAQHKWVAPEQFDTLGDKELKKLIERAYEIVKAKKAKKARVTKVTRVTKVAKVTKAAKVVKTKKPMAVKKAAKTGARRPKPVPARRGR